MLMPGAFFRRPEPRDYEEAQRPGQRERYRAWCRHRAPGCFEEKEIIAGSQGIELTGGRLSTRLPPEPFRLSDQLPPVADCVDKVK